MTSTNFKKRISTHLMHGWTESRTASDCTAVTTKPALPISAISRQAFLIKWTRALTMREMTRLWVGAFPFIWIVCADPMIGTRATLPKTREMLNPDKKKGSSLRCWWWWGMVDTIQWNWWPYSDLTGQLWNFQRGVENIRPIRNFYLIVNMLLPGSSCGMHLINFFIEKNHKYMQPILKWLFFGKYTNRFLTYTKPPSSKMQLGHVRNTVLCLGESDCSPRASSTLKSQFNKHILANSYESCSVSPLFFKILDILRVQINSI